MTGKPDQHQQAESVAKRIIERLGGRIVLALPLGLGKANLVANALFERAADDRTIDLEIFTALTLEKPSWSSDMERRFIEPLNERLYSGYPGLAYAKALRDGSLPENVRVSEFFFVAGRWLSIETAQQSYVSANYTHAGRYVLDRAIFDAIRRVPRGAGGEIQLTDAIALLIDEGHPVHVVVHRGDRHDLGNPGGYLKAAVDFALKRDDYGPELRRWLVERLGLVDC